MASLTDQDVLRVSQAVVDELKKHIITKPDLRAGLDGLHEKIREDFSDLQTSVDRYLKRTEE